MASRSGLSGLHSGAPTRGRGLVRLALSLEELGQRVPCRREMLIELESSSQIALGVVGASERRLDCASIYEPDLARAVCDCLVEDLDRTLRLAGERD